MQTSDKYYSHSLSLSSSTACWPSLRQFACLFLLSFQLSLLSSVYESEVKGFLLFISTEHFAHLRRRQTNHVQVAGLTQMAWKLITHDTPTHRAVLMGKKANITRCEYKKSERKLHTTWDEKLQQILTTKSKTTMTIANSNGIDNNNTSSTNTRTHNSWHYL